VHTHTPTAQDTEDFGWQLASARPAGSHGFAVIYLSGELGTGKTTFARGFMRALGVTEPVRSPTYMLVELYGAGELTVVHVDLYRLRTPAELEHLGLREWATDKSVWLIEWPERAGGRLPPPDLQLSLTAAPTGHDIEVSPRSVAGRAWLAQLTGREGAGQPEGS
jgi:tRNA threonylcarbamoyladenosine biosynthesis protein TsaE